METSFSLFCGFITCPFAWEQDVAIAGLLSARGIVVLAAAHARDLASLVHSNDLSATCGIMAPEPAAAAAAASAAAGTNQKPTSSLPAAPLQRMGLPAFSSLVELVVLQRPASNATSSSSSNLPASTMAMRVHPDLNRSVGEMVHAAGNQEPISYAGGFSHLRYLTTSGRVMVQTG